MADVKKSDVTEDGTSCSPYRITERAVKEEDRERIWERFYQADESRTRESHQQDLVFP